MYDCGIGTREAWRLTPREASLLQRRHRERMDREETFVGLLYAAVSNPHRQKGQRPIGPADVFPHLKRARKRDPHALFEQISKQLKAKPES